MPGVVDLSDLAAEAKGVAKVVLESVQDMLLKLALQIARDDYEDRRERQRQGVDLAKQAGCSESQVKRVCALAQKEKAGSPRPA